ncbi:MAG TPA: DUF2127 domain-containing protein [Candidatus Saccharimonadales bacterium]|nr:DUF2127 domain-containing protein [Candidatus Saccharimonadales bacterium]
MDEKLKLENKRHPEDLTDKAFHIALYLKAAHGALEIVSGIILLIIKPETISSLVEKLTTGELSEDKHDFVATHVLKLTQHLTEASLTFAAIYLLAHGIARLVLVIEVFRDHLWAYIGLIIFTAIFVIYQSYHMIVHFTLGFLVLTIIDLIVIYLTQKEYRRHKAWHQARSSA